MLFAGSRSDFNSFFRPSPKIYRQMTMDDVTSTHVNTDALKAAMDARDQQRADEKKSKAQGKEERKPLTTLSSCVDYNDIQDNELYYVGTAGVKVTELDRVEMLQSLQKLHVRSNLLDSMANVASLVNLEHLELYDNQIQAIDGVQELVNLKVLDLSFNEIRVIPDLSHLEQLEELYVANNKLKKISGIENLSKLRKLDLGANRLRTIEGLHGLLELKELWLGKNKITTIQGLEKLIKLKIISVQSNRVVTITGFTNNVDLEELYLSHNGIEKIENIEHLVRLFVLCCYVGLCCHANTFMVDMCVVVISLIDELDNHGLCWKSYYEHPDKLGSTLAAGRFVAE